VRSVFKNNIKVVSPAPLRHPKRILIQAEAFLLETKQMPQPHTSKRAMRKEQFADCYHFLLFFLFFFKKKVTVPLKRN